jgi:PEP-CTERM motif
MQLDENYRPSLIKVVVMKTKLFTFFVSVAIGILSWTGGAGAGAISLFNVDGSFASDEFLTPLPPVPLSLTGTLSVDVTMGTITASDLRIPNFAPLNVLSNQFTSPNGTGLLYQLNVSNAMGDSGYIDFIVPLDQSNPLIEHRLIDIDQGEFTAHSGLVVFGLTGSVTAVPEPGTWAMIILGFAGLAFAGCRRAGRGFRCKTSGNLPS